jgi:hypothetical protein
VEKENMAVVEGGEKLRVLQWKCATFAAGTNRNVYGECLP